MEAGLSICLGEIVELKGYIWVGGVGCVETDSRTGIRTPVCGYVNLCLLRFYACFATA